MWGSGLLNTPVDAMPFLSTISNVSLVLNSHVRRGGLSDFSRYMVDAANLYFPNAVGVRLRIAHFCVGFT